MNLKTIILLLAMTTIVVAQEQTKLDSILDANTYAFDIVNNKIVGSGKAFLENEAANSQFFLVGELHGNNETPTFTSVLIELLKPHDYNNFVIETSPNAAKKISDLLLKTKGLDSIAKFYKDYEQYGENRYPIPFFDAFDEVEMLQLALDMEYSIWGIDQEFIFSTPFLFDEIYNEVKISISNKEDYKQVYLTAKKALLKEISENSKAKFHNKLNDRDIEQFFKLSSVVSPTAKSTVEEIIKSWQIYDDGNRSRKYNESNTARAKMMKSYFSKYYNKAKQKVELPKVLVKMGNMHLGYGKSPLSVYDIGNTLNELSMLNNSKTFNTALAGRYYIRGNGEKVDRLPYVPEYEQLFKHEKETGWTILDLRPLKNEVINGKLKIEDKKLWKLILRYDSVLLKTLSAATEKTKNYKK